MWFFNVGIGINMCLAGMVAAIKITSLLGMGMLRKAFVTSVCRLTMLHAPAQMHVKNAKAFRAPAGCRGREWQPPACEHAFLALQLLVSCDSLPFVS